MTTPIKRRRRSKTEINDICEAIYDVVSVEYPMTVRQVFYQLVTRGVIVKSENEYKSTVCRLLLTMRRDGRLPYNWISDNTRWMRKPRSHNSMEAALEDTARTYRRSLWKEQPAYVEVWLEKDALAGVLLEATEPWDVPLMVTRGFSSETYLYEAAQAIREQGKPAYLYFFGDHDPSGVAIIRAAETRLRAFAPEVDIHVERIAVTPEQIVMLNLPTRPTKTTDSRSRDFIGKSVEVDAIPPSLLRTFARDCIERHIDKNLLARSQAIEERERAILRDIADRWAA